MIPASFEYHRPRTVDEAVGLLAQYGDEARVLAGGHSLIPMMKLRMAVLEHLVDLQDIGELRGVREEGDSLVIGAMTTQQELLASDLATAKCPILAETARLIADPQVRACGTVGGNVANGDPGNDMPALMQALDATYRLRGPSGDRTVKARDFYDSAFTTALEEGEILTAIAIPTPPAGHGWAYEKQKRKIGDYATAAAAVVLTMSDGTCTAASIGLTNVADTPLFAEDAAAALVGTPVDDAAVAEAVRKAREIAAPAPDGRGPVDFRIHVTGIVLGRAIARAKQRTGQA